MQNETQTKLNDEEWLKIRDFTDSDSGFPLPRYEAKYVEDVGKQHLETEFVLIKETNSFGNGERIYHLPPAVFEAVVDKLH